LDTRFTLTKGQADFSQLDTLMPYLDIEGHSRVGQYDILLTVKGPVENMHMLLRSQPPLSRQQIISLITLRNGGNRKSSSLSNDDISSLVGSGVRMTLNSMGITSQLERFLSLDMLNVTAGSLNENERITNVNKNYYNIEMGKYLFNDFMITGAFGLNHNDNRIGFRYELGTHFGIEGWSSDGQRFIGGQYRYTFF
jgi:translocation and assembly module TamB